MASIELNYVPRVGAGSVISERVNPYPRGPRIPVVDVGDLGAISKIEERPIDTVLTGTGGVVVPDRSVPNEEEVVKAARRRGEPGYTLAAQPIVKTSLRVVVGISNSGSECV